MSSDVRERMELSVARHLAEWGLATGESLRFMRMALDLNVTDLALLLRESPDDIIAWESDMREIDRRAWATLSGLVLEKARGVDAATERAAALKDARSSRSSIRIDLTRTLS